MKAKIEEGDMVDVHFEYTACEFGVKVLYTPCATGDSWRFERRDGTIVYVNSFSKMVFCGTIKEFP